MSIKKSQIQTDALNIVLPHRRAGLGISMGVGKTLIGLRYIEHFRKDNENLKVLVVAPKISIFNSWRSDAEKFDIPLDNVDFSTYLSLNKQSLDYDVVVLDECHSLLDSHVGFLGLFQGRILGLTGTPPRYVGSEKGRMVQQFCPIKFTYITDEAVEDDILNDYRIIVHRLSLSSANNILVRLKDKEFYTSEVKNYNYSCKRVEDANSPKQRQIALIMRMRSLMDYKTKEDYAKKLLHDIEDKCLVFANTQAQAERLCTYAIHSNNPDSEEYLRMFNDDEIDKAACVLQLNEGVNIKNLRTAIILHAYGNERKSAQRIGRLLRLNPDDMATVHILCYRNTVDEQWVAEALKDLDNSKIKYFDI